MSKNYVTRIDGLSRRDFLGHVGKAGAVLAFAPVLSACAREVSEDPPPGDVAVDLTFGGTRISEAEWPLLIAEHRGLIEENGIDLNYVEYADIAAVYTAYRGEEIDCGIGGLPAQMNLRSQGVPIIVTHGMNLFSNDLLVRADSEIETVDDMRGRRIGIFGGPGGASANMFFAVCRGFYDFDPVTEADLHFGAPPLLAGMLGEEEIDVFLSLGIVTVRLLASEQARSVGEIGELYSEQAGHPAIVGGLGFHEQVAEESPEAVTGMIRAFRAGVQLLEDDDDVWQELANVLQVDDESVLTLMRDRYRGRWPLEWNDSVVQEQMQLIEFVQEYADEGFLEEIDASLLSTAFVP